MIGITYRAGVLSVSKSLTGRARMALPPEHKVAAIKDDPELQLEVWLIEGARMPPLIASGKPEVVSIQMTLSPAHDHSEVRLDAAFHHDIGNPWRVGTWPDFETFRASIDRL